MSVPEIERLRRRARCRMSADDAVFLSDAERAVLTALGRQRREIVEALREHGDSAAAPKSWGAYYAADFIESRFGGKEGEQG